MIMHSLAEGYHWSYEEILSRTMPQILMLNHAAWIQNERRDAKIRLGRAKGEEPSLPQRVAESVNWDGKDITQMTTAEYLAYHASAMR